MPNMSRGHRVAVLAMGALTAIVPLFADDKQAGAVSRRIPILDCT